MKKRVAVLLLAVLSLLMACVAAVPAGALTPMDPIDATAPGITPYWNNTSSTAFQFYVLDPGTAYVDVSYTGHASLAQVQLTVKIQKRFLGLFWNTVEIGYTDDQWVAYSTSQNGNFYNTFAVDGTGTYRAKFTMIVTGTDGSVDEIEETLEYKYE